MGIVTSFILFIGFVLFFVLRISTDKKYAHQLVTEDYYAKELVFQQEIEAEKNMLRLDPPLTSTENKNGWEIRFPSHFDPAQIKGTVSFYRPSDRNKDFQIPLQLEEHRFTIPKGPLALGRWNLRLQWTDGEKDYLFKEALFVQ